MKKHKWLNWLTFAGLFWTCFFLPIKTSLSNVGILILILSSLISFFLYGISTKPLRKTSFYTTTTLAIFLPILIGSSYAPDFSAALAQLSKCIFYALLPILLLRSDLDSKWLKSATLGLIVGCCSAMLYLLGINLFKFQESGLPLIKLLSYKYTGKVFMSPLGDMHPVYFGSYHLMMLLLVWHKEWPLRAALKWVVTIIILIGLLFVNSRIIFLIGLILLVAFILKNFSLKKGLLVLVGLGIMGIISIPLVKNTYVFNKLIKGSKWELSENINRSNTKKGQVADSRMSRWIISAELFKEKPLLGHGTASARPMLYEIYEQKGMEVSLKQQYDSHNQYLAYAIQYGVIGLGLLIIYFGSNLFYSIKTKNFLLFTFVIILAMLCMTENYLIRNMGINFAALFGSLLILRRYD